MPVDVFLEVIRRGTQTLKGETRDREFGRRHAIEINSFKLGSGDVQSAIRGAEQEERKSPSQKWKVAKQEAMDMGDNMEVDEPDEDKFTFTVNKTFDSASPDLFVSYCEAAALKTKPFEKAIVSVRKTGQVYLVLTFEQVYVTEYAMDLSAGDTDGIPDEDVTFCFSTCKMEYWKQQESGRLDPQVIVRKFDFFESNKAPA